MDRAAAPFRGCDPGAGETVVTRRTVLSGAAGLAMLAPVRSGFAQAAVENAYQGRNRTMDIKRNGSRPSGKGPEAWFTGTVRVDPMFQRRSSYFRTRWPDHVAHPSARPDP